MVSTSGCVGWLKKRTNLEKTLLSLSSLLLLTLLLVILINVAFRGKKSEDSFQEDQVCFSSDCIKAAGDVLSSMDPSADKCMDFYSFACGKYGRGPGQTSSVPKRAKEFGYFSLKQIMESDAAVNIDSLKEVKNFYNSCVKFGRYRQDVGETGESLLSLMTDMAIGIWPVIDSLYDTSKFSLEHTLVSLILLDVPVVFRMDIVPDEHADNFLVKISPGGPRESGRSPSDIRSDVHLRSSVLTSFLLVGSSASITDVYDILSVDSSFAAIEQEKSTPCDDVTTLTPQEVVKELNRLMPEIDWNITISEIRRATGLLTQFAVELHCKQKIRDYAVHLNDLTIRSESNYLGWRFFSKFVDHVIPTFEKSQFGTDDVVPRWRVCLELMERFASPVLASALTHSLIDKEIQEIEKISEAALAATKRLVSRARWLNDLARPRILQKVSNIRMRYPFQERDSLRSVPVAVPQVEVRNFTAVVIRSQRQWVIQKFKQLGRDESSDGAKTRIPVLSERKSGSSPDYNAFVYIDKIRNPYMRFHGSKWMNYGGFGVSVAREISKILMSMNPGRSQAESAELWNVWSRSRNSSMCLDRSYTALLGMGHEAVPPQVTEKLMRDIFLEQSALEIAYETATAIAASSKSNALPGLGLKNEELFFVAYAQTLCDAEPSSAVSENIPVKDRLNKAVSNFETFNQVFSCVSPSSKCHIWA